MNTSPTISELSKALCAAQGEFKGVEKGGHNTYDHYRYSTLENFVAASIPVLTKHGLAVVCSCEEVTTLEPRKTSKDTLMYGVRVKLACRIIHGASGEWLETFCYGEGLDRSDKAIYKSLSGARKYALASALGLATVDDPENDEGKQTKPAASEDDLPPL